MADVALISVIASGTVGALGAAAAAYAPRVTLAVEERRTEEARRDDLRGVLDDAAQTAMQIDSPITGEDDRPLRSYAGAIDTARLEVDRNLARIGVRLGPESTVFLEYLALRNAAADVERAIRRMPAVVTTSLSQQPPDEIVAAIRKALSSPQGHVPQDEFERVQRAYGAAGAAIESFENARSAFLTAAAEQVNNG